MTRRRWTAGMIVAAGVLWGAGGASATTLGSTTPPAGATQPPCSSSALYVQVSSDPSTPYIVPTGGQVTQWQTGTQSDTAGMSVELVVLRPAAGSVTVVGVDTETLPTPLPSGNVATFTLPHPIQVQAGDTFGLFTSANCAYYGGGTPAADTIAAYPRSTPVAAGETLTGATSSPAGYTMNLAVTLLSNQDAAVMTSGAPSLSVGGLGLLGSTVTDNGPGAGPITFTDQVPAGLQVQSAVAGLGTCAVTGQTVTCTISGLAAGQSTSVDVLVTPSAAVKSANTVSVAVAAGVTDPVATNNTATAQVTTTHFPSVCIVPQLRAFPVTLARRVLAGFACRVRLVHRPSATKKNLVSKVLGGIGTFPAQHVVTLVVSSGPKRH